MKYISIHVPREGDDALPMNRCLWMKNFYPRPPRGGRPTYTRTLPKRCPFLSTSPARGTTIAAQQLDASAQISIHVPREGDDQPDISLYRAHKDFYPRPPRGGRLVNDLKARTKEDFYPRPPRGGRHLTVEGIRARLLFLSTSPARGTTVALDRPVMPLRISIHVPREGDDSP